MLRCLAEFTRRQRSVVVVYSCWTSILGTTAKGFKRTTMVRRYIAIFTIINPPTIRLFRSSFTAKGVVAPPWIFDSPTKLCCAIISHKYVFWRLGQGIQGDSKLFLSLSRDLETEGHSDVRGKVSVAHGLYLKGQEETSQHLLIEFRTPWPRKHRCRQQDYLSSMFPAINTSK